MALFAEVSCSRIIARKYPAHLALYNAHKDVPSCCITTGTKRAGAVCILLGHKLVHVQAFKCLYTSSSFATPCLQLKVYS